MKDKIDTVLVTASNVILLFTSKGYRRNLDRIIQLGMRELAKEAAKRERVEL